jgi:predicted aspartyl protease
MGKAKPITLRCLLDTGATASLVASKHAKKLRHKKLSGTKTVWTTPGGSMSTTEKAQCTFMIPEFHTDRVIEWDLHMSSDLGAYDMIMGRDLLSDLGFKFDFTDMSIEWDNATVPMKDTSGTAEEAYYVQDPETIQDATERLKVILDAKYTKADLKSIAEEAIHLNQDQQKKLRTCLEEYEDLFDGTLGKWDMKPYEVELQKDAKPYHAKAYPIPRVHQQALKTEVDRLVESGVLKKINRSEWAAPTFIIPKKDGSVRFISDFRELNKRIKRKPYPIPKIQDMLLNLEGFKYATSLDLNMGYYHIELSPKSKTLCTIVLPFGKYEYQRLPMGLSNSPDIFQEKMSDLMQGLEFVRAYIDDFLIITKGSFEEHLDHVRKVMDRLRAAGLNINAKKSFFAKLELEYLGYWIT